MGEAAAGFHMIRARRDLVIRLQATEQLVVIQDQEILTGDGAGIGATIAARLPMWSQLG